MKIEVKIMPKEDFNEDNLSWSEGVLIDEFILNPYDIEFKWKEEELSLPYKDFIFFGREYYYGIFINDKNINDEVEIIEEDKDIEELGMFEEAYCDSAFDGIVFRKINELVREVNKLKGKYE